MPKTTNTTGQAPATSHQPPATILNIQTFLQGGLRGELVRGALGSVLVKSANAALSLIGAVLLARFLKPEGYGTYAFALSAVTLLAIPAQMGFPALLVRETARYRLNRQWDLLRGLLRRSTWIVLSLALVVGVSAGLAAWFAGGRVEALEGPTLALALLALPFLALSGQVGAVLNGLHYVVLGQLPERVLRPALLTLAVCVLFWLDSISSTAAAGAYAVSAFLSFLVGMLLLRRLLPQQVRRAEPRFDSSGWLRSILPLSLLAGMHVITGQTDILMLGFFTSSGEVGIYRVAVHASALVVFTLSAINTVMAPSVSRLHAAGDQVRLQRMVTQSARVILLTALPVAGAFIVFGHLLLQLFFGSPYQTGYTALAILCLGQLVNAGAGSVGLILNMTGYERDTARGLAVAASANILFNLLLIPIWGMEGAALATTLTLSLWNVLLCRKVHRRLGIRSTAFAFSGTK